MNLKLKIFFTNWINLLGIFLAAYVFSIINALIEIRTTADVGNALRVGFLGGLLGIILYGVMFWLGFIVCLFLLDIVLMNGNKKTLRVKLLIEWLLLSVPFIYWFIRYMQWIFLVAVIAFFITQFLRSKKIENLLSFN